ncbi:MAG: hypothetical protein Q4D11_04365 [Rhodospirillales bacterium]|nr:hypothetical protein [Rhodospirillales bacterium]
MYNFDYLLTDFSPDDIAEYTKYSKLKADEDVREKSELAEAVNTLQVLNSKNNKLSVRIKHFFSRKTREADGELLNHAIAKVALLQGKMKRRDYDFDENFAKLSVGAKQYAACKSVIKLLHAQPEEISKEKIIESVSTLKDKIAKHPLMLKNSSLGYTSWENFKANMDRYREKNPLNIKLIKHSSLSKFFKHTFCDNPQRFSDIIEKCDVNPFAGCLPPEWIGNISKDQRSAKTKEVSKIMSDFASMTYSFKECTREVLAPYMEDLSKKLSEALKINDMKVSFIGAGEIGKAFKIQTGSQAVVMKTEHANPRYNNYQGHGIITETAYGLFVNQSDMRKSFVRTYCGRVGINSASSFLISRFIDKRQAVEAASCAPRSKITQIRYSDDHEGNMIAGKIIDLGGIYVPKMLRDRQSYKLFKTLYKAISDDKGEQLVKKVTQACERDAILKRKYNEIIPFLNAQLKKVTPDISSQGIQEYGYNDKVMTTLGVNNKVDFEGIVDAFQYDNAEMDENKTVEYIIRTRGGIGRIEKDIELRSDTEGCIPEKLSLALVKNGVNPRVFARFSSKYTMEKLYEEYRTVAVYSGTCRHNASIRN